LPESGPVIRAAFVWGTIFDRISQHMSWSAWPAIQQASVREPTFLTTNPKPKFRTFKNGIIHGAGVAR
jgi:hypothetical protein